MTSCRPMDDMMSNFKMQKFEIIKKEKILQEKFCPIEKHIVRLPNGQTTDWFVNTSENAVIVVPVLTSGEILLQKNYKHGSREIITEFCAGLMEKNEDPKKTATRELMEETGYETKKIIPTGEVFSNPTGSTMKYYFFVALDCEKKYQQFLEPSEQIEPFTVKNWTETINILQNSKTSAATISALFFAKKFLI